MPAAGWFAVCMEPSAERFVSSRSAALKVDGSMTSHPLDTSITTRGPLARRVVRGGDPGSVDEADVDTVEMELRPEDLARLAQIPGAEDVADGAQSIQVELAAGLEPRPPDLPPASPRASPAPDGPAPTAQKAPIGVTDAEQISKPRSVSISPIRKSPVSSIPAPLAPAPGSRAQVAIFSPAPQARISPPVAKAALPADPAPSRVTTGKASGGGRWLWITLIVLFAVGAASVWLSSLASFQAADPPPRPPAPLAAIEPEPASRPVAPTPEPTTPPPADGVQFRNPFDAAEVFDFPAGTHRTDARQAVARFLLQRACQRQLAGKNGQGAETCGQASAPADLLRDSSANAR